MPDNTMRSFVQVTRGQVPRRVHRDLGGLKDDELGRRGFQGRHAQLYRRNDPTRFTARGRLRLRNLRPEQLAPSDATDPAGSAQRLFGNADCQIWLSRRAQPMPFYRRNADGDELHFVHAGTGRVETEFGTIPYEPGDHVVLPKAVTHRVVPAEPSTFFIVETVGELEVPDYGLFGRHTPFDPSIVFIPEAAVLPSEQPEYEVRIRYDGGDETIVYPHNPCDVEGWRGDYFPWKLNIRDWNVVMSDTLHLVPTVHAFLQAPGVWVLNFLPRPLERTPGVERLPYYHRNADYDEIAFFHGGSVLGAPLPRGLVTHSPQGLHHGVPEAAREHARATFDQFDSIDWQIIAVDTVRPLRLDPALEARRG
jgi:homogentisate 1,2-dioxygenase